MTDPVSCPSTTPRQAGLWQTASDAGLLKGPKLRAFGGEFSKPLIDTAMKLTGITDPAELLTYALAKVVLEDDGFGERLLARKGSAPRGLLGSD
ncbi:hypothetical protein VQH23_19735 [Pararoseomonas sp. SCSIO 73927]|uniref:hypothetical protein n=1 Tax=Pararoseomonas sp. SCSIO 73927 TaxID=3114537 RepID=UPI0030D4DC83